MSNSFVDPNESKNPVEILRNKCSAAGSYQAWATAAGVPAEHVEDVLHGQQMPSDELLTAIGLRRVVTYLLEEEEFKKLDRDAAHMAMGRVFSRIAASQQREGDLQKGGDGDV